MSRADELAWLRSCWAPRIAGIHPLARFYERVAAVSRPVAEPWHEVESLAVVLDEQPELEVEARLSLHRNNVMDLAVAPSGRAASIDFSGVWSVWLQTELREQVRGGFGREARAITLSDDGMRMAALVNLGPSALYNYDAFIVPLDGDGRDAIPCPGEPVERIRWEDEFLVLGNMLGYRIHDAAGQLICVDASPKGLSATCFVRGDFHCIRRNVLGGVQVGTDHVLPCLDLAALGFDVQTHFRAASLDVRKAGDLVALGPCNKQVFVLELPSGRPLVKLVLEGVPIVNMKLAFDESGRYLLMSATHIRGQQVSHLIYDGRRGAIVGRLTTSEGIFHHHARIVMSSDRSRVFAVDGDAIVVARVPSLLR